MCGIFGYVGRITDQEKLPIAHEFLSNLAIASEARGTDATGFACRWPKNIIMTDKQPVRASHFIKTSHKFAQLKKCMPTTFIGHTRLGTGSSPKINNNNHPFLGDDFIMVHNGIIPSWKDYCDKHKLDMESETDSEIVLRLFEQRFGNPEHEDVDVAVTSSVEWILDNVWGNMAIALLSKKSPHLWLFRNENPIWVWNIPFKFFGGDIWFFSSTKDIFEKAWKDTFKNELSTDNIQGTFLADNQLFRLSTISTQVRPGESHKFIYYPLFVAKKFRKKKQYYGPVAGCEADESGRYSTSSTTGKCFYSKYDPEHLLRGGRFSQDDRGKIKKYMDVYDKEGRSTWLDGLTLSDFVRLQDVINELRSAEGECFATSKE